VSLANSKYVFLKIIFSSPFKTAVKPKLKISINLNNNKLTFILNIALITFSVYYIIFIFILDTLKAPYFNNRNITEFLEFFKNFFEEYYIKIDIIKYRKLPRYYGK
jgi:hypothetical protein